MKSTAPIRPVLVGLSVLALSLAACGDPAGTDDTLGGLEPTQTAAAVDALLLPIQFSLEPRLIIQEALPVLMEDGMTLQRAPRPWLDALASHVEVAPAGPARVEFPPEILGATYIYDDQLDDWVVHPDSTSAPSNGVRVIWYATDATGMIFEPVEKRGFIDMTDEDSNDLSRLGLLFAASTTARDVPLLDITQGFSSTDGTNPTEHLEASGFYGDGESDISLDLALDVMGGANVGTVEGESFTLILDLADSVTTYALVLDGAIDGATGDGVEDLTVTATYNGSTTRLEIEFIIPASAARTGSGTLFHDGEALVDITVTGNNFEFSALSGEELSSTQTAALDRLVQSLSLTGLLAFFNLPLLYL